VAEFNLPGCDTYEHILTLTGRKHQRETYHFMLNLMMVVVQHPSQL